MEVDFERLSALLQAEGAMNAAARRTVYDRLRADIAGSEPVQRKNLRLSLEGAIGKVEQAALATIRSVVARPALVVEDYIPAAKDRIAA